MEVMSNDDKKLVEQFRNAAIHIFPEDEKMTLWRRIERETGQIGRKIIFARYFRWAAAASIALAVSIGYLWYNSEKQGYTSGTAPDANIVVVETRNQQKQMITLPDSTIVWLNANSRLEYSANFNEKRVVRLEGEACFDVARQEGNCFTVHALEFEVTVLGTVFNITAYKNEADIVTTLIEGKIALQFKNDNLQQTVLTANQQAVFNKELRELSFAYVDTELFISWTKGYYKFENTSFEQIAKHFERMYGIEIIFENEDLKNLLFTGTFLYEQNVETALELLQLIMNFKYETIGNKVIIKLNK